MQNVKEIPTIKVKHSFIDNYFSLNGLTEWKDLLFLRNAPSINVFKKKSLKLLTRLRYGLSNLRGHKFNHNFSDCLCVCMEKILNLETISSSNVPYFLKQLLMNKIRDIDGSIIDQNENSFCHTLLSGKENMNGSKNTHILNATIEYILSTERFKAPLFQ